MILSSGSRGGGGASIYVTVIPAGGAWGLWHEFFNSNLKRFISNNISHVYKITPANGIRFIHIDAIVCEWV